DLPVAKRVAMRGGPVTFAYTPFGGGNWILGRSTLPPLNLDEWLLEAINAGNPFFAAQRITFELACDIDIADAVPHILLEYVLIHGIVAAVCIALVITRLRAVTARQTAGLTFK